jgi:aryl-alcohol dehydrogenase-like predicted oxidoreductase
MNHRHLGQSGLVISEISYGNWITHGSQVEMSQELRVKSREPEGDSSLRLE